MQVKTASRDGLVKQCPCDDAKWPKCPHPWHYTKQVNGRRYSKSLKSWLRTRGDMRPYATLGDAEKVAVDMIKAIYAGTFDAPARPSAASTSGAPTFDAWADKVGAAITAREIVSAPDEVGRLAKLAAVDVPDVGRFGALALDAITSDHVECVYAAVTRGLANGTRRKYRRLLRRAFRMAVTKRAIVASPITDDTAMPAGLGAMRSRRVSVDVEANLVQAANEGGRHGDAVRLGAMIVAAIETGARRGELLAIQWRDVEPARYRILIRAVEAGGRKTGKARYVPLTARLVPVLDGIRTSPTGEPFDDECYVFGDTIGGRVKSIKKAWHTAVLRAHNVEPKWTGHGGDLDKATRAKLQKIDLHFHDLRHEAALRWNERGLHDNQIAKLLGHVDLKQLRVYLGIDSDDALDAVAALDALAALDAGEADAPTPAPVTRAAKSPARAERQNSDARSAVKVQYSRVVVFQKSARKAG
jgi:integrase